MSHTEKDVVLSRALQMPEHERAEIAEQLIASLDDAADIEVEHAWQEEVGRRIRAIDHGVETCVPWEEVRNRLRETSG